MADGGLETELVFHDGLDLPCFAAFPLLDHPGGPERLRRYYDGYVDLTGRLKGFGVANLIDALPGYDWRLGTTNLWKVEQMLIDWPHRKFKTSIRRYRFLLKKYRAYRAAHPDRKPTYYRGKEKWEPLPKEFRQAP